MPPRTRIQYSASDCTVERLHRANWQDLTLRSKEEGRWKVRQGFLTPDLAADFILTEAPLLELRVPELVLKVLERRLGRSQPLLDPIASGGSSHLA